MYINSLFENLHFKQFGWRGAPSFLSRRKFLFLPGFWQLGRLAGSTHGLIPKIRGPGSALPAAEI
jgi:hypothetical protein